MARRPEGGTGEAVELAADKMAEGMAGKCVGGEEQDVYEHHERPRADAETFREAEGEDGVVPKEAEEEEREVEKITVQVLQDERKAR